MGKTSKKIKQEQVNSIMMENESEYIGAVKFGGIGNEHHFRKWLMPFGQEIQSTLEVGSNSQIAEEALSRYTFRPPTAVNIDQDFFVQVILFFRTELGSWAAGKVFDFISSKIIQAAKKTLTDNQYEGDLKVTVVYANNLTITVNGPVQSDSSLQAFQKRIPEAQQKAFTWQQSNKTTDTTLIYKIKDNGSLSDEFIV